MASYEFRSLGEYKEMLIEFLVCCDQKSDLLMDITMLKLDDERFSKTSNFLGINQEYNGEYVKTDGYLFDIPFVYTTVQDTRNMICFDTNISKINQNTKQIDITINVMCHKASLQLDKETQRKYKKLGYYGNRLDIMVALIGDILNYSNNTNGIGTLVPSPSGAIGSYFPNDQYFGKILHYTCSDFMVNYSRRFV